MRRLRLLRHLGRQDGISLVMAVGVLAVLSISGTTVIYYSSGNARSAELSSSRDQAYDAAEAGISHALSILANAVSPITATLLPQTTITVEGGASATYSGTLSGTLWTITSAGTVDNPADPTSADASRTLTRLVEVHGFDVGSVSDAWNRVYTENTACQDFKNMTIPVPMAVKGPLCLKGTSKYTGSRLEVGGLATLETNASIGVQGPPQVKIPRADIAGGCKWAGNPVHIPCVEGDRVYADSVTVTPTNQTKPTADFLYWYKNAKPGPAQNCTTGSFAGGFDNDYNAASPVVNGSRTAVEITPAGSSYTCQVTDVNNVVIGELSWNHVSKVLTVKGTIFIDGPVDFRDDGQIVNYQGRAVIYAGDGVHSDEVICAGGTGTTDCRTAGMSTWDPVQNMLVLIAGGAPTAPVNAVHAHKDAAFQGILYSKNNCKLDSANLHVSGPIICNLIDTSDLAVKLYTWPPLGQRAPGQVYNTSTSKSDFQLVLGSQSG